MPRRTFDDLAVFQFLLDHERIATHRQLRDLGVPLSTITRRIRPRGPWQRGLPGVVIAHSGTPTARERLLVAQAYGGSRSVLTGRPALRLQRAIKDGPKRFEVPHLLIPHELNRTSHHFVLVERTRYLPEPRINNGLRLAPIPRALADATRRGDGLDEVRELVSEVAQRREVPVDALVSALDCLAAQRSAAFHIALDEISAGIRSVAEARARELVMNSDIPEAFIYNPTLWTPQYEFIASPDGYVQRIAAGYELDSFAYHLRRQAYLNTQRRHRRVSGHGVWSIGFSPVDVINEPLAFISDLRGFLAVAADRAVPTIVVRPATSSSGNLSA